MSLASVPSNSFTPFEQLRFARDIIRAEADALSKLSENLPIEFQHAAELLVACEGSTIVTGVGKAGWIGQKVSASLASTGTRSHFLHPAEAMHGDLGRVCPNDVILAFSNSGETAEILQLLPTFRKLDIPLIAITGRQQSNLVSNSNVVLCYGKTMEAGHLGLAPSTSTALMLALGDALSLVVSRMKNFEANDFARFHPGGSLGKQLSLVDEIMRPLVQCRVASELETVRDIYIRFGGKSRRAGVVMVTNGADVLTGLFTDSDLVRLLERQQENLIDRPIKDVMTKTPVTIQSGQKTMLALETLACRNLSEIPIVDADGRPLGLIDITDVLAILPHAEVA